MKSIRKSFTLIELLVVMSILGLVGAVLTVIVLLLMYFLGGGC